MTSLGARLILSGILDNLSTSPGPWLFKTTRGRKGWRTRAPYPGASRVDPTNFADKIGVGAAPGVPGVSPEMSPMEFGAWAAAPRTGCVKPGRCPLSGGLATE